MIFKKTIAVFFIIIIASVCLADNKSESEQVTINPDNRGIDYSPYEKEKDNQLYFNSYFKKNGYWNSDDYEMKIFAKKRREIFEEKKKNELLLNSVYEVNPDAFNQLARIYRKIKIDDPDRFLLGLMAGIGRDDKSLNQSYLSEKAINTLSQDSKKLAREFNAIADRICIVYQKIPRSEFSLYFDRALNKGIKELQKVETDTALKNMAINIKTIRIGADSSDEVINKLGVPTFKIYQDGIEIIKYKYDLNNTKDNQSQVMSQMNGQTMQVGKSVIAEIQCDANGKVSFISVTKTDPQAGSVDEIYKVGQRNNSPSLNSL
jgi:hypothetical protein